MGIFLLLYYFSLSTQQAAEFINNILNTIFTDMHLLVIAEDEGFQKKISTFNPTQVHTFFKNLLHKFDGEKYEEITGKLKFTLKETVSIALTTDIWISVATESYQGVMCHFLVEVWEMKCHSLTTLPLE